MRFLGLGTTTWCISYFFLFGFHPPHSPYLPHPPHSYGKDVPWLKNVVKKELGSVEAKRIARLEEVYHQFDLEGDDSVGIDEMFALGTEKRRNLTKASADDTMFFTMPEGGTRNGQKTTPWTRELAKEMVEEMGCDEHLKVSMNNFVKYWLNKLASDSPTAFNSHIVQCMDTARSLRAGKSAGIEQSISSMKSGSAMEKELELLQEEMKSIQTRPWKEQSSSQLTQNKGHESEKEPSSSPLLEKEGSEDEIYYMPPDNYDKSVNNENEVETAILHQQ